MWWRGKSASHHKRCKDKASCFKLQTKQPEKIEIIQKDPHFATIRYHQGALLARFQDEI